MYADTILVFTETEFHALAGQKKLDILQQLEDTCMSRGIKLRLHLKTKVEGGVPQMKELMDVIKSKENPIIGTLPKVRLKVLYVWNGLPCSLSTMVTEFLHDALTTLIVKQYAGETNWGFRGSMVRIDVSI